MSVQRHGVGPYRNGPSVIDTCDIRMRCLSDQRIFRVSWPLVPYHPIGAAVLDSLGLDVPAVEFFVKPQHLRPGLWTKARKYPKGR
jgi:hypothetical protein